MKIQNGVYFLDEKQPWDANVNLTKGRLFRFTVKFPIAFKKIPVFVANSLQDMAKYPVDLPDTFAISVKSVTLTEAVAQVYRVDQPLIDDPHTAQQLRIGWIAISDE